MLQPNAHRESLHRQKIRTSVHENTHIPSALVARGVAKNARTYALCWPTVSALSTEQLYSGGMLSGFCVGRLYYSGTLVLSIWRP